MQIMKKTFNETIITVAPVIAIALLLNKFLVDISQTLYLRFILGVIMIIRGLTIFLYGIETGVEPVSEQFGHLVAESKSQWIIPVISFFIGFAVTVTEPDLLILGQQIEQTPMEH